jgi:hypothetical protein
VHHPLFHRRWVGIAKIKEVEVVTVEHDRILSFAQLRLIWIYFAVNIISWQGLSTK